MAEERGRPAGTGVAGQLLKELNGASPARVMQVVFGVLQAEAGARGVRLLLADVGQKTLNVWGDAGSATRGERQLPIDGPGHGEVYRTGRSARADLEDGPALIVPVSARREREGVL